MSSEFWHQVWKDGQIAFNQASPHPLLMKFTGSWKKNSSVFVPLCGKSIDMMWLLNNGFHLRGVELSEFAVKAFVEENKIPYQVKTQDKLIEYSFFESKIFVGDYFNLEPQHIQNCSYVYDRASLIALPTELRKRYMDHFIKISPKAFESLLLLFERKNNPDPLLGPPYNVTEEEVKNHFSKYFEVSLLQKKEDKVHVVRDNADIEVIIKALKIKKTG